MKIEEAFSVVDGLLNSGFVVMASGKEKLSTNERSQEVFGTLNSWFILSNPKT